MPSSGPRPLTGTSDLMHAPQIFVDFDGTITLEDTTDLILERFAAPAWKDVEQAWVRGAIGSRECMAQQVALLRATPEMLDGFIATLPIDPGFLAFARLCSDARLPLAILSDGLDRVARQVLTIIGVDLPVISNQLVAHGRDEWRLHFPHARDDCPVAAGNCKCATLAGPVSIAAAATILIGDGRSDFCGAAQADFVFAKGALAAHCRRHEIPHLEFTDFVDLASTFVICLDATVDAAAIGSARLRSA